jgi:N-acetylglutamate synthase-like GNAT family acetyltransferase
VTIVNDNLYEVRPTSDLDELRRLGVEAGLEGGCDDIDGAVAAWGAFEDGRMIGGVTLETYAGLHVVNWLSVSEGYRGRGVGARLLAHLESEAVDLGIGELWATARAPGFFMRRGYSVAGGGGEREALLPGCDACAQYEVTCNPKIVRKALVAEAGAE